MGHNTPESVRHGILSPNIWTANSMTPSEILINACENIARQSGREQVETWIRASSLFCEVSSNPLADFISAEEVLNETGQSAVNTASSMAASSFEWDQEKQALASILRLTNLTGLAALRFTAAWLAFNMNDFEMCIAECEKIDDHGYHVHGLMGQAFLENGQPDHAINSFKIALAMNEKDAAIWFQMAKAAYVSGDLEEAWQALEACGNLNGPSAEIAVLQCAVACNACESGLSNGQSMREKSMRLIRHVYANDPNRGLLLTYASRLALFSGSEPVFIEEVGSFHDFTGGIDASGISTDVSEILKLLQKKGWYKGAACLLGVLTNVAGAPVPPRGSQGPDGPTSA